MEYSKSHQFRQFTAIFPLTGSDVGENRAVFAVKGPGVAGGQGFQGLSVAFTQGYLHFIRGEGNGTRIHLRAVRNAKNALDAPGAALFIFLQLL